VQHYQSSRVAWPALAACAAAVLLFFAVADLFRPPATVIAPEQFFVSGPRPRHCASCGWIEAKRELAPLGTDPQAPKVYEYTLRMPNGSTSVFQETLPTSWRVGERLVLIEGSGVLE
jgi:hypothetical protein